MNNRERVLLKSFKKLTEAAQYARFAESATRVAMHSSAPSTTTINAINSSGVSYGNARQNGGRNQQQQLPQNNGSNGCQWMPGQVTQGANGRNL